MNQVTQQGNYFLFTGVQVVRVVDGDTLDCTISVDCGFHNTNTHTERFRIKGFDAPETSRRNYPNTTDAEIAHGKQAYDYAITLLNLGVTQLRSFKNAAAYDRWEATITLKDGTDFAATMRAAGMEKRKHYD